MRNLHRVATHWIVPWAVFIFAGIVIAINGLERAGYSEAIDRVQGLINALGSLATAFALTFIVIQSAISQKQTDLTTLTTFEKLLSQGIHEISLVTRFRYVLAELGPLNVSKIGWRDSFILRYKTYSKEIHQHYIKIDDIVKQLTLSYTVSSKTGIIHQKGQKLVFQCEEFFNLLVAHENFTPLKTPLMNEPQLYAYCLDWAQQTQRDIESINVLIDELHEDLDIVCSQFKIGLQRIIQDLRDT